MASIPGARFDITGTTGSSGALTPKSGWRAYVFPRGGYASADSTGTLVTFDSSDVASRFAANNWVQVGLSTANIRQVSAVGGNSMSVSSAVTVSENDRVYLIGSTQPTVSGGSATYTIPQSIIRQRDDDAADIYTNSMVTSNSDGMIQFFGGPAIFDVLIQDGNQGNQGSIIDLPVGAVEGISTSMVSVFGASVTINANVGITGSLVLSGTLLVGQTSTVNGAFGATGWATFGASVTVSGALGVTGTLAAVGRAAFGNSVSIDGALGVTGVVTTGSSATVGNALTVTTDVNSRRLTVRRSTLLTSADFWLSADWGSTATISSVGSGSCDMCGTVYVRANGATFGANPIIGLTFADGAFPGFYSSVTQRDVRAGGASTSSQFCTSNTNVTRTAIRWEYQDTPQNNQTYGFSWLLLCGSSTG